MRPARHVWSVILFLLPACGPGKPEAPPDPSAERYAEAFCSAAAECGCVAPFFSSSAECVDVYVERVEQAVARGLALQRECLEKFLQRLEDAPCETDLPDPCSIFVGDVREGETCSWHADLGLQSVAECRDGARCFGTCVPEESFDILEEGDACWSENFLACHDPDLYCGADGECLRRQPEGEACRDNGCEPWSDPTTKAENLYCQGGSPHRDGVCAIGPALGEPCNPLDWPLCRFPGLDEPKIWCEPATSTCVDRPRPHVCELIGEEALRRP